MSLKTGLRHFATDTRGNIAVITVFLLVPILVIAGGATDIARQESYRAHLQDSVDRAVLAAAPLDQTLSVTDTVREYLKSLPFADQVTVVPTYTTHTNSKVVTLTASYVMPTYFLHFIGKPSLKVIASATAEEKRTNIEISLILDVSGSMREISNSGNRRIDELKPAAKEFLDLVLSASAKEYTSVNIVPYAGDVNVSAAIFNALRGARTHNNSSCFERYDANYTGGMPNLTGRAQVPHFSHSNNQVNNVPDMDKGWCPSEASAISILSDSATVLKQRITDYRMADGTGTAIAMNWGILLLNPALQDYVEQAAQIGMVPKKFKDRPAEWNDANTKKFIVLMTDGKVVAQQRPKDPNRDINLPTNSISPAPQSESSAAALLQTLCTFAKGKKVTIFTIGFQVPSSYEGQMQSCASSASHYYPVQGLDIKTAFRSIWSAIQKIRLTG